MLITQQFLAWAEAQLKSYWIHVSEMFVSSSSTKTSASYQTRVNRAFVLHVLFISIHTCIFARICVVWVFKLISFRGLSRFKSAERYSMNPDKSKSVSATGAAIHVIYGSFCAVICLEASAYAAPATHLDCPLTCTNCGSSVAHW